MICIVVISDEMFRYGGCTRVAEAFTRVAVLASVSFALLTAVVAALISDI